MKRYVRTLAAIGILGLTVVAFMYYIGRNPRVIDQLMQLPLWLIVVLLMLYGGMVLALALLTFASLRVYGKRMGRQESLLFNAYSLLINFFGPGQSGPAFRGVYLKKKHDLSYKKYLFVTLIYYAFYAVLSAMMMFVGTRPWWQTLLLMGGAGLASWFVIRLYKRRNKGDGGVLTLQNLGLILAATVLQLVVLTTIYFVELRSIGANVSLGQVLAYTGVANFALFVALTPGAIGIREAFLVFSQNLHGIDSDTIVAASIVDRAVYLLFLGLLFVAVIALHAKDKLGVKT